MALEYLAPGFLYTVVKDVVARIRGRHLSPAEKIQTQQKWKAVFDQKLWERQRQDIRTDVIIRDVKRHDRYPNLDDKAKDISPWFRAGLMGTYYKGVMIGLQW